MRITIEKPNIKGTDIESLRKSVSLYLLRQAEALDTMLGNIDDENLSESLRKSISGSQTRTDALTTNMLNLEARMSSTKNNIEVGDGYLRLGGSFQICYGSINAQHTDFKKQFSQTPKVVFDCNSSSALISSTTTSGFNLNITPTSGSYIAIGVYA